MITICKYCGREIKGHASCPGCGYATGLTDESKGAVSTFMIRVESSNIRSIGYIDTERRLIIEFVGGGVYEYRDVDRPTYIGLMDADSKGKYFHSNVRSKFECEKLRT